MARSSQTETSVLGALSVEPMSGYAIREAIRDVLGHFWSESYGQIYPTLTRLEAGGLVRRQPGDRAGASVFALTAAGRDRLAELLRQPISPTPPRNGVLLRLFFGQAIGPEACRELVTEVRDDAVSKLASLAAVRAEPVDPAQAPHQPYRLLTVLAGEHSARAALAWADEALAVLDVLSGTEAPDSRHH